MVSTNINGDPCDQYQNITLNPHFAGVTCEILDDSPCINAGDSNLPYDPDNTIADQGAFYNDQSPSPDIGVSDSPILFGNVAIGNTAYEELTIYNTGELDLIIYDITCSVSEYTTDYNPADSVITPGSELTITVSFTPTQAMAYIEEMTIENNDELVTVGLYGIGDVVGVEPYRPELPTELTLQPAFPNPFNPETNLIFDLPEAGNVTLQIFDGTGCHIATLANGFYSAGSHLMRFNAQNLPSGTYFARFTSGGFATVQRLTLTK